MSPYVDYQTNITIIQKMNRIIQWIWSPYFGVVGFRQQINLIIITSILLEQGVIINPHLNQWNRRTVTTYFRFRGGQISPLRIYETLAWSWN